MTNEIIIQPSQEEEPNCELKLVYDEGSISYGVELPISKMKETLFNAITNEQQWLELPGTGETKAVILIKNISICRGVVIMLYREHKQQQVTGVMPAFPGIPMPRRR